MSKNWFEEGIEKTKDAINPFNKLICEVTSVDSRRPADTGVSQVQIDQIRDAALQSVYGSEQIHRYLIKRIDDSVSQGNTTQLTKTLIVLNEVCADKNPDFIRRMKLSVSTVQSVVAKMQLTARANSVEAEAASAGRLVLQALGVEVPAAGSTTAGGGKYVGFSRDDDSSRGSGGNLANAPQSSPSGGKSSYQQMVEEQARAHRAQRKKAEKLAQQNIQTAASQSIPPPKVALESIILETKKKRVTSEDLESVAQSLLVALDNLTDDDGGEIILSPSLPDDPFACIRNAVNSDDLTTLNKALIIFEHLLRNTDTRLRQNMEEGGLFSSSIRKSVQNATQVVSDMAAAKADLVRKSATSCLALFPAPTMPRPQQQQQVAPSVNIAFEQMNVRPRSSSNKGSTTPQAAPPLNPPQPPPQMASNSAFEFLRAASPQKPELPATQPMQAPVPVQQPVPIATPISQQSSAVLPQPPVTNNAADQAQYQYMLQLQQQVQETQRQLQALLALQQSLPITPPSTQFVPPKQPPQMTGFAFLNPPTTEQPKSQPQPQPVDRRPRSLSGAILPTPPPVVPTTSNDPFAALMGGTPLNTTTNAPPSTQPPKSSVAPTVPVSLPPKTSNDPFASLINPSPAQNVTTSATGGSAFSFVSQQPKQETSTSASGFAFIR